MELNRQDLVSNPNIDPYMDILSPDLTKLAYHIANV
jgi:hypothetical protein